MSNPAIQAQWSLDESAGTAWNIMKGLMVAATGDHVSPIALMSCERFGNTLAMSSETVDKIHHILVPWEPAPISFLKGTVGFSRNDCATQLGRTGAGLRFLGLAAALVTSLGAFNGAKSLELMLRSTTDDLTLLPTTRHLRDLLGSLEARSHRCGFADSVVGWQILLRKEVLPYIFPVEHQGSSQTTELLQSTPSPEAIAGLVHVFRQVARMGPASVLGATIRVGAAAPWVLAFAQWCVEPPSLSVGDKKVLEQPRSRLRVVISSAAVDMKRPFEVTIHHQLENLHQIVGPPSSNLLSGMVTVESYRTWLLEELGFRDGMLRLLREALEHAIPQLLRKMECGDFTYLGQDSNSARWRGSTDNIEDRYYLSPLPDIRTISTTCATFLALKEPMRFVSPDDTRLVAELPLVFRHLQFLKGKCRCANCCTSTAPGANQDWCEKKQFFRSLSFIIMDIFALSLFDSPLPLLVKLSRDRENNVEMEHRISEIIVTGYPGVFDDMNLLGWARNMAGHRFDDDTRSLIITSSNGQVIYPNVFNTFYIEKQGYLKLCCLPGTLKYQDEIYDVVSYPDSGMSIETPPDGNLARFPENVSRPLNLFGDLSSSWKISVQDNRELYAELMIRSKTANSSWFEFDPLSLLLTLRNTLLVESCPHDRRTELKPADRDASYSYPWDDHHEAGDTTSHVNVVAVDGADDLRCFALAQVDTCVVLRRNSCLGCCLNVCRDTDVHVLIL